MNGFHDLCIPYTSDHKLLKNIVYELFDLGYTNLAIEQIYDDLKTLDKDKKQDPIPAPVSLDFLDNLNINVMNRLSIIYSDNSISHLMGKSLNIKKYHLIAAIPVTEEAWQYACQTLNCDIIAYNNNTIKIKLSRKYYFLAINRNIYFEIKYAPAIEDSIERKAIITRSHHYHSIGKSKNIIISSGATNILGCRGPYDVANLGLIFGLSEDLSKRSILSYGRKVILRAEGRRHGKTILFAKSISSVANQISSNESSSEFEDEIEPTIKKQKLV